MIGRIRGKLRELQATAESRLLAGTFSDYTEAMILVERRRTLINAIEIVSEVSKLDEDEDEQ